MQAFLEIDLFPVVLTLLAFHIGQRLQKKWPSPLLNPTLIGMILVVAFILATGMDTGAYQAGVAKFSWLMTPATISLAIPMYEQFQELRKNLKAILAGVAAGTVCCLATLLLAGLALKLDRALVISLLPKSVTTAIGMPLSELCGGIPGITVAAIIVTGIAANMLGPTLCRAFHITEPIAQGVAFGTSGHVIGTAKANELSPLTGAVSSLSLVVAGLMTAVLLPLLTKFL